MNRRLCCKNCDYLECYANRTDDMGKLTIDNLHSESPEWCPLRERESR